MICLLEQNFEMFKLNSKGNKAKFFKNGTTSNNKLVYSEEKMYQNITLPTLYITTYYILYMYNIQYIIL